MDKKRIDSLNMRNFPFHVRLQLYSISYYFWFHSPAQTKSEGKESWNTPQQPNNLLKTTHPSIFLPPKKYGQTSLLPVSGAYTHAGCPKGAFNVGTQQFIPARLIEASLDGKQLQQTSRWVSSSRVTFLGETNFGVVFCRKRFPFSVLYGNLKSNLFLTSQLVTC